MNDIQLALRWHTLLVPPGPHDLVDAAFIDLIRSYTTPDRRYHTLAHLTDVLGWLDRLVQPVPVPLELAGWLHDLVYDPRRSDNEERSAEQARLLLPTLGVSPDGCAETARLILLTRTHEADDHSGQALLDADLAILGADPANYAAYAVAIRQEYAWVPEAEYRQGRRRVLERFLQRDRLYHHPWMREHREARARVNLQNEIAALT